MTRRGLKRLTGLGMAVVLGSVFSLYVHPQFMVTVAQQVWACF